MPAEYITEKANTHSDLPNDLFFFEIIKNIPTATDNTPNEPIIAKTISLKAVEDGRTIPMDEVNDQTFAQELLGPGIAIVPSNGTVVSPINGTIATVMDTKHAVCIQGEDGLELIVHAGLDTVELNGKYYQTYKEIGDQVKAGDVLLEFDLEEITKAGYDVTTPIVITNLGDYKITKCLTGQQVKAGEEVIQLTKQ